MLSYPNFVVSQLSTTDSLKKIKEKKFQARKSQPFCLKMTCILSVVFFYDGCHFSDFGSFLEGRLPPEDGSDRAENLTRSVSDESAKNIFLARQKKSVCHFSNVPSILGFLQFERFDILGFLQFERFDIWASCSSSVLTF